MASRNTLRLYLTADGRVAVKEFEEVGKASENTADQVEKDSKKQTDSMKSVEDGAGRVRGAVSALAGTIGLGGLAFGIKDVVEAGMQWQQQQVQLQNALKNTGQYSARTMAMVRSSAESLSTHGGFAGPQEIGAITQFIRLTGSATKAIQLNRDATALARGTNLGYTQAQRMIGQVLTGNTGRLQRYLGIIQPVKTAEYALSQAHAVNVFQLQAQAQAYGKLGPLWLKQQEILHNLTPAEVQHAQLLDKQATATEVLRRIQERYGGSTQAFSKTTSGAISNLRNSFDILEEHIGAKLLPVINTLIRFLDRNKGAVLILMGVLAALAIGYAVVTGATAVWGAATTVAGATATVFTGIVDGVRTAILVLGLGFEAMGLDATAAWAAATLGVTLLVAALILVVTHFHQFKALVAGVFNWLVGIVTSVIHWIEHHWQLLASILGGPFVALTLFVVTHFNQVKHVIEDVVNWIWSKLKWLANQVGGIFGHVFHFLTHNPITSAIGSVANFVSHPFGLRHGGIVRHLATGGVLGGYGGGDRVPAMLEPGEGVLRKEAVQGIGSQAFNSINATGSIAGAGAQPDWVYVAAPIQLQVGQRVMAEQTVHFAARKSALSGHYTSG